MNIYGRHTISDGGSTKEITTQLTPNTMFQDGVMAFFDSVAEKEIPNRIEGAVDDAIITNAVKQQLGITNVTMTKEEKVLVDTTKDALSDAEKQMIISSCSESDRNAIRVAVRPALKAQIMAETMARFNSATSSGGTTMGDLSSMGSDDLGVWNEMLDNPQLLHSQYDVVAIESGADKDKLFEDLAYNEIILVVDENGNLSDYNLYALGIKTSPTIEEVATGLANNMKDYVIEPSSFNHSDVIGKTYPLILETDFYQRLDNAGNIVSDGDYVDIRTKIKSMDNMSNPLTELKYNELVDYLIDNRVDGQNKIDLKIKAIVKPKEGVSATSIGGAIGYSHLLTEKIINMQNAEIIRKGMDATMVQTIDVSSPTSVSIYCTDFESKAEIERIVAEYNEDKVEEDKISYTDFVGIMMSSISTIINAISYVLIAFVSISLIVSSIMIGIITYISVLERIKEIGVLRSVGASKKDVKRVFTAESLIIGTMAGVLGIVVTLLLNIPINIIIHALAGLSGVAALPIGGAFILIGISMLLTFIAGLIPAHIASKKDPVIALRTE
ncbi:MAG: ABC transporter permease [Clostridiales bacterium]|nr:ABC transporter permease [Clostridiales bacterium]